MSEELIKVKIEAVEHDIKVIKSHVDGIVENSFNYRVERVLKSNEAPRLWTCDKCKFWIDDRAWDEPNCQKVPELHRDSDEGNCPLFRFKESA